VVLLPVLLLLAKLPVLLLLVMAVPVLLCKPALQLCDVFWQHRHSSCVQRQLGS
jgi:hypothetical protein